MSIGLRTGIAQHFLKNRLSLPIDDFERYLAKAAGCEQAVVSVSLGTPGVHRKPVFQIMDRSGRIRAFAKAGWNHATNELVMREASALRSLRKHVFSTAKAPRVLNAGWYNSNYVLVTDAAAGGFEADREVRRRRFTGRCIRRGVRERRCDGLGRCVGKSRIAELVYKSISKSV